MFAGRRGLRADSLGAVSWLPSGTQRLRMLPLGGGGQEGVLRQGRTTHNDRAVQRELSGPRGSLCCLAWMLRGIASE